MHVELADESAMELVELRASDGLAIRALPNGCLYAIQRGEILINQILASPVAGGVHRVYLRVHDASAIHFTEIVGPAATSLFAASPDRLVWSGTWRGLQYRCTCWLHPGVGGAWFHHVEVKNTSDTSARCDGILVQDVGLATRGQVRNNELFTSQYIDHFATTDPEAGYVLMSRQNLPQPGETHPWLMQGCFPKSAGFTTDGFDFFGARSRGDAAPERLSRPIIGQRVCQYETAWVAIQSEPVAIEPSGLGAWTFFARFVADHREPSSAADLERLRDVRAMSEEMVAAVSSRAGDIVAPAPVDRSVFQTCELFDADDLSAEDVERRFPAERRHEEMLDGRLQSFFAGDDSRHVVLRAKELAVERPHGHVMRAGHGMMPDDEVMSLTSYAVGVFASQLTLGNAALARLLSGTRDPLNLIRSNGLRIFVRAGAGAPWRLLGVPSAFEMATDQCRWHYRHAAGFVTVSCTGGGDDPTFAYDVRVEGEPIELLVCGEIAAGPSEYDSSPRVSIDRARQRIAVQPDPDAILGKKQQGITFHVDILTARDVEALGGDELLYKDGESHRLPYFALRTRPTTAFTFKISGTLGERPRSETRAVPHVVARVTLPDRERAMQVQDTLAWFARDAVVHLSTPRGLEQPNGGAWGVRDVCQGPVEFLLSYDQSDAVRDVLRVLFAQQYHRRGDWPQWFMFSPFHEIRSSHAHGDVVVWPLKALCDYLEHTDDGAVLHERLPYTDDEAQRPSEPRESILEHCDRALRRMREQFLPGVALPRYGEGDWDDSLQPADPVLRERMVSAWTAELMFQTLRRYAAALARFGEASRASAAEEMAGAIAAAFQEHMMPGGVVAGFAVFDPGRAAPVEYLLHPSDSRTGLRYRLIPMTRGILSGIFSREQAERHLELIREHLLYPDGARLMDRPTEYRGGVERTFRRSESASFFGREIGLQYVHAHLRYAEALAVMGRADELWRALLVVNPIAVTDVVQNARPRQRNCYFSSSDAGFPDRYAASRDYAKLRGGDVPVDAGWRIYSSGPGIYTSLVIRHLFGIRRYFDQIEFDPVLPCELDGAVCELLRGGRRVRYAFSVGVSRAGLAQIRVNGTALTGVEPVREGYRAGGVRVAQELINSKLTEDCNAVEIAL